MTNLLALLRITITNVTICDDYLMNCIYTERHCFIKRLLLSSSFWVNGLEFNFPIHLTKKKATIGLLKLLGGEINLVVSRYTFVCFILRIHRILHFYVPRPKFLEPKWSHSYNYNLILYCSNHIMQRVISVFLYYFLHIFRITLLIFFSFNRQYK